MAASLVGGAAVGVVFGELLKAVLDSKGKATKFQPTLANLTTTLTAIDPLIKEMEQQNEELGRPKEELESLIREMKEGTKLVYRCSKIHWSNICCRIQYQEQLVELRESLERFFKIDVQAQTARDVKEALLELGRMRSRVNKLPFFSIQGTTDSSFASVNLSQIEMHDSAVTTQPLNGNAMETNSAVEDLSQTERHGSTATIQLPNENSMETKTTLEDLSQIEIHGSTATMQPPNENSMETSSTVEDLSEIEIHGSAATTQSPNENALESNCTVEDLSQVEIHDSTATQPPNENAMETNSAIEALDHPRILPSGSVPVPIPFPDYVSEFLKSMSVQPTIEAAKQVMENIISVLSVLE